MISSKSPRRVMLAAYHVAKDTLPEYFSKFSRKDFTKAQLFACLHVYKGEGGYAEDNEFFDSMADI